jgi:hypothetical protein
MRIMFVGSNPEGSGALAFERDINALQKRLMNASGLDASFVFLPSCPVEELPQHLAEYRPEILHFAAHGEDGVKGPPSAHPVTKDDLRRVIRFLKDLVAATERALGPVGSPRIS